MTFVEVVTLVFIRNGQVEPENYAIVLGIMILAFVAVSAMSAAI